MAGSSPSRAAWPRLNEDVSSPSPQLSAAVWEPVALPVFLSLLACLVAAIAAVRIRYRRGTGIERLSGLGVS